MSDRIISVLHLESTDVCQAACPLCARETDADFNKKHQHHLTMAMINQMIPDEQIQNLDKMFMCGNYGDPAAGRHTLDIYRYFRRINPEIVLGMNSNGAIQNTAWWQTLGEIFHRQQDYVVFSIDGLEDTNHIYRRGVDWNKLIENAKSYISTGASAHWDMLVYQHNQHQVDACERLARDLGFTWFRAKVSKRPLAPGLSRPVTWMPHSSSRQQISCHALKEQSMYMDCHGRISPCCWLGNRQRDFVTDFDAIQKNWHIDPHPVCAEACGSIDQITNFNRQWQRTTALS